MFSESLSPSVFLSSVRSTKQVYLALAILCLGVSNAMHFHMGSNEVPVKLT